MRTNPLEGQKIVIDGRYLAAHRGGIGRYTRELIKNILAQKLGIDLILIVRDDEPFDPDLKKVLDETKEKVEVLGTKAEHYSLKEQWEFLKLLNGLKADLVHFVNFNHPVRYRKPFVTTIHDLTLNQFPNQAGRIKRSVYNYIMRHAAEKAEVIFTVSEYSKNEIARTYSINKNKIIVTYNGIGTEKFRPISNSKILQDVARRYKITKPFVLYVGQWGEHKNLARLIDAFVKFNSDQKYRDKYQLVIAGASRDSANVKEKVEALKAQKSILLPGFIDDKDLPALYNAATLFAFPSLSEGFGIPPLEAMACGTPVISSNTTSLPEVLGQAALYFNPRDTSAIANALEKGLTDSALRRKLSAAGREQAAQYSWTKTAEKTVEGYIKGL